MTSQGTHEENAKAEAHAMKAKFEARRLLPRGAVNAALNKADAWLAEIERECLGPPPGLEPRS